MGFLDFMKKIFLEKENNNGNYLALNEDNLPQNQQVKESYLGLEEDLTVSIAKIKQRIMAIKIYYPEEAEKIEEEIRALEEYMENYEEVDLEAQNNINSRYQNIKERFQNFQKTSEERFLFSEVKRLHIQLDKMFFGEEDKEHTITDEKIEQLEQNLQVLDKNKTKFTEMKQQQYIKEIIDARYRLKCCKMANQDNSINLFEYAPEVEKIFYANLFVQDIQDMYDKIERIKFLYKIEGLEISLEEQEKVLDSLIPSIIDAYTQEEERTITDIFRDSDTMERYIQIAGDLRDKLTHIHNNIQEEKDKIEEERKTQQEQEYYKNMQEEDMLKKIRELESDSLTTTDAYKAILEYEKEIAQAKGLLEDESTMCLEDIEVFRIENKDISKYWLMAKESGVKINIFPSVDNRKKRHISGKTKRRRT